MTYFQVTPGQTVASSHMNAVMNQSVMVFASAAARDAALPAPTEGMTVFLNDTDQMQTWTPVAGWQLTNHTNLMRDTGWRDVSAMQANGFTGLIRIRRTGWLVSVNLYDVSRPTAVPALATAIIATAPPGFEPSPQMYAYPRTNPLNITAGQVLTGASVVLSVSSINFLWAYSLPAGGKLFETWVYPTSDAWPTTLPGAPAAATAYQQPQQEGEA